MKCPVCGAAELTRDIRDLPYTYKDETTVITAVTGEFCSVCGESILDPLESSRVMSEMSDFSTRPRYTLAELLSASDYSNPQPPEERDWIDTPAVRDELI